MSNAPTFLVVDLFCGFGGTTTGFHLAKCNNQEIARVIACVNHDPKAIRSHWLNNPDVEHFNEDITRLYGRIINGVLLMTPEFMRLIRLVELYRALYPNAKVILWASLECTNFSKAKGGMARDADSRTLADHLDRYIRALDPDYIKIENVVEFKSWGPLISKTVKDENGYESCPIRFQPVYEEKIEDDAPADWTRVNGLLIDQNELNEPRQIGWKTVWHGVPESPKNGKDWLRWRKNICSLGYLDDWKELNSANFGAYTSRNRLFGIFAKPGLPMVWPEPTHAKSPGGKAASKGQSIPGLFDEYNGANGLKKWMAVKEVLDFSDEGESIFNRKKPLADNTLERIYAGLVKYVAKGDTAFLSKYFSGTHTDKNISIDGPAGAVTTVDHHAVVQTAFLSKYYSGDPAGKNTSVDDPAGTLRTKDGQALVQTEFLVKYNSRGKNGRYNPPSIEKPCPVISTQDRLSLVQPEFIIQRNGGEPSAKLVDLNGPARTLTSTGGNQELIQPEFLTHYYSGGGQTSSVNDPCPTVTAMDGKALIQPEYFIEKQYSKSQNQSIEDPAGTLMPTDKHRLVTAEPFIMPTNYGNGPRSVSEPSPSLLASRRYHYLINPSWGGNPGSVEEPCCVIVARQDKAPLYFVHFERGAVAVAVFDNDSLIAIKIKQFMAAYGLVDIKMRMLRVPELLRIQGFPDTYKMVGNQGDQKKFIGNSVVPHVVKAWAEAIATKLSPRRQAAA